RPGSNKLGAKSTFYKFLGTLIDLEYLILIASISTYLEYFLEVQNILNRKKNKVYVESCLLGIRMVPWNLFILVKDEGMERRLLLIFKWHITEHYQLLIFILLANFSLLFSNVLVILDE
ncbi:hypothetical protein ACJX0J_033869, partial [Zea mays]